METLTIIFIALGLSADALAVSIVTGSVYKELHVKHALRMAIFFGGFQALMPLAGWLAGLGFRQLITTCDHWLAFGLLSAIGVKMIYESFRMKSVHDKRNPSNIIVVLVLSIATSIDALAVGVTLSLLTAHIFTAVLVIGLVTFALSWAGCCIGQKAGHFFENKIEIIGGLILIGIGFKILLSHILV